MKIGQALTYANVGQLARTPSSTNTEGDECFTQKTFNVPSPMSWPANGSGKAVKRWPGEAVDP
jgi:hypothetical protein